MNVLNLCLFSLLILGASVQAKNTAQSRPTLVDPTINYVAKFAASYVEDYFLKRKNDMLNRFSKELVSLNVKSDHCTLKKAKKIQALKEEFNASPPCDLVPTVVSSIGLVLQDSVSISLQLFRVAGALFTSLLGCFTTFNPECVVDILGNLVQEFSALVPQGVELFELIVMGFVRIFNEFVTCYHTQAIFEDRFDALLKTSCHEM